MAKLDAYQLRQAIGREEFDHVLLSSVLSAYAAVPQKINELLKAQTIVRVKKGLYVFGPAYRSRPVCRETLANLIFGPSCISLEYALFHHGFIPERVETITSVTPKKNKEFATPLGRFTYRHVSAKPYPHGMDLIWIDSDHPVLMATPEKALCDYLVVNKLPAFSSKRAAREFLEADLRIDTEDVARFDLRKLVRLNSFYQSGTLTSILEAL